MAIAQVVTELDMDKLPQLIELKYHSMGDAVAELGPVGRIRAVFVGFQQHFYRDWLVSVAGRTSALGLLTFFRKSIAAQ